MTRRPGTMAALALALAATLLPAPAPAQGSDKGPDRDLREAAQRILPSSAMEAVLRAAICVFAEDAQPLGPLPSNIPWARPAAIVVVEGLPGLEDGARAALFRPTRELLARAATRARIAEGGISLHALDLTPLPPTALRPAFMAVHVARPDAPPEGCIAPPEG